jgi:hypothetical protein
LWIWKYLWDFCYLERFCFENEGRTGLIFVIKWGRKCSYSMIKPIQSILPFRLRYKEKRNMLLARSLINLHWYQIGICQQYSNKYLWQSSECKQFQI